MLIVNIVTSSCLVFLSGLPGTCLSGVLEGNVLVFTDFVFEVTNELVSADIDRKGILVTKDLVGSRRDSVVADDERGYG